MGTCDEMDQEGKRRATWSNQNYLPRHQASNNLGLSLQPGNNLTCLSKLGIFQHTAAQPVLPCRARSSSPHFELPNGAVIAEDLVTESGTCFINVPQFQIMSDMFSVSLTLKFQGYVLDLLVIHSFDAVEQSYVSRGSHLSMLHKFIIFLLRTPALFFS